MHKHSKLWYKRVQVCVNSRTYLKRKRVFEFNKRFCFHVFEKVSIFSYFELKAFYEELTGPFVVANSILSL